MTDESNTKGREYIILGPSLFRNADYPERSSSRQNWQNRIGSMWNKYNLRFFRYGNWCFPSGARERSRICLDTLPLVHALTTRALATSGSQTHQSTRGWALSQDTISLGKRALPRYAPPSGVRLPPIIAVTPSQMQAATNSRVDCLTCFAVREPPKGSAR